MKTIKLTDEQAAALREVGIELSEPVTIEPPAKVWTVPEGKFYLDVYGDVQRGNCADISQRDYGNSLPTIEHAEIVARKVAMVQIIYAWIFDHYPDYREPEIGEGDVYYPAFDGDGMADWDWRCIYRLPTPGMSREIFDRFKRDYEAGRVPQLTKLVEGE